MICLEHKNLGRPLLPVEYPLDPRRDGSLLALLHLERSHRGCHTDQDLKASQLVIENRLRRITYSHLP